MPRVPNPLHKKDDVCRVAIASSDEILSQADFRFISRLPSATKRRAELFTDHSAKDTLLASHLLRDRLIHVLPPASGALFGQNAHASLSRRAGWIACAASKTLIVAVDIEFVAPVPEMNEIAKTYFPNEWARLLLGASKEGGEHKFTGFWSALESVAKVCNVPLEEAGEWAHKTFIYQGWLETASEQIVLTVAAIGEVSIALNYVSPQCYSSPNMKRFFPGTLND